MTLVILSPFDAHIYILGFLLGQIKEGVTRYINNACKLNEDNIGEYYSTFSMKQA